MNPGTVMWNMMATLELECPVSYETIHQAITEIIRLEKTLSLRIGMESGIPFQYYSDGPIPINYISFRNNGGKAGYLEWLAKERLIPLDLINGGALAKFILIEISNQQYTIFCNTHHIIIDGTSIAILINRIAQAIREISLGKTRTVHSVPQFPLFTSYEDSYISSADYLADKEFWQKKTDTIPEPVSFTSHRSDSIKRETFVYPVSPEICNTVYQYCNRIKTSPFRVFLTAFSLYTSRLTGNEEIVLGTAFANRYPKEMNDALGMFVSTSPLFLTCNPESSFYELLVSVTTVLKETQTHSRYPYESFIADVRNKTGESYNFIDYTFVQNIFIEAGSDAKATYHPPVESENSLCIFCRTAGKGEEVPIDLYIEYNPELFTKSAIERIAGHIESIVGTGCVSSDLKVRNFRFLGEDETNQLLCGFNSRSDLSPEHCLHELIHNRAIRQPDNIAIVYQNTRYTYAELDEMSTILAEKLVKLGAGKDQFVGILADRSAFLVIAQVAVLKAGTAFMPIDPSYPPDRIRYMIADSACTIMLTSPRFIRFLEDNSVEIPNTIDLTDPDTFSGTHVSYEDRGAPSDLAVLIYTSGSTGNLKGVMLEHRSFVNFSHWFIDEFSLTDSDNVAKHASFSFDLSMLEIYPTLIIGATLHIISEEIRFSLNHLNEYFEENAITIAGFTTQFGEQFMEYVDNSSLRYLLTGGEKLRKFKQRPYTLYNIYGPTECTIMATYFKVEQDFENIPIGYAIPNYQITIIDHWNNLQPIGIPGELCISGISLARGYLNLPEKTADMFIEDPFMPGERLYKTGDLACWNEDGCLLHLGRMDRQVKIRGFRIELGEIEKALMEIPEISEAAVIDFRDDTGRVSLCGYYVPSGPIEQETIKEYLHSAIPEFMVPSFLIALDEIPKTQSGKIDRRNLPKPEQSSAQRVFVEPEGDEEVTIARIFEEVLDLHPVGALDDFFSIGGDSIKAILVISRLESKYSCSIPFREFFRLKTPRGVSSLVTKPEKKQFPKIISAPLSHNYPVTEPQQQIFMLEQLKTIQNAYSIPLVLEIKGDLDKKRLSDSLMILFQRHEVFRTKFAIENGETVQIIEPEVKIRLSYEEIPYNQTNQVIHAFFTRFDLEKAPLVKIKLVQCSPEHFILLLNIHHIIADGISISLIFDELSRIYSGEDLKPPTFQFKDYAVWLNTLEKDGLLKENDSFWIKYLTEYRPAELLTDNERPKVPDFSGKTREFILDSDLTTSLHDLIEKSETTLHSTLMGIIGLLYSIYTQQKDVVIGTTTNGRGPEGSDSVVGMFVETIPVRVQVTDDLPVISYLQQVRDNLFDLFDHQPFSLSRVYETVAETRGPGRHPFIDLNVNIQNMKDNSFVVEGISSTRQIYDLNQVKFDISIGSWEKEGHIFFKIDYRSPLFSDDTIRYLELHLLSLIRSIVSNSSKNTGDYELIDDEERTFLLREVNNTKTPLPEWTTIGEAVTRSCLQYPEKRAIVAPDGCITYNELNIISDQIAGKISASIKDVNTSHDSIIGIIGDRSFLTVAAMVGALKTDTPYVVIDPGYPEDRIRFILEDTKACLLIGREKSLENVSQYSGVRINLDTLSRDAIDGSDPTKILDPSPNDLAYLIYTSGSTGKPKGVMIEHHSMVNFIAWYTRHHQFDSGSRSLEFASLSFDVSVVQIFAPLVTGGELHIIPESLRLSPHDLDSYCEENRITHAHFPTQFAEQFIQVCSNKSLKRLVVGGDRLKRYKIGPYQLVNEYGPTETTMASTSTEIESVVPNPPIGYPIANTRIYVLGTGCTLLPVGIPGELYIAGEGVSRGYLNKPDLTSEKFLSDPFVPGERMYRTGDRVRIRSDGMLEYIGRIDFQVKIRGYRIEPGEIESAIRTVPGINNAVVLAIDDTSIGKYLCGYYEANSPLAESELKSSLRRILPEYMIPARFVHLASFPLNRNGKVDRKLLPGPDTIQSCDASYEYPRNQTEQLIADAWKKVLGKSCISITDDFFDIGADSLRAIALLIELEKNFKVSISDIFSFRTIADQAANLPRSESGFADRIPLLINLLHSPERTPDVIAKETVYADTIRTLDWNKYNLEGKRSYKTILLTGVTGTLGGYLLRDLLELTGYDVVLITRGRDQADAQNRVTKRMEESFGADCLKPYQERISIVQGDLSSDHCGLDEDTWDRFSLQVDAIIHSAALTKHIGDYQEFYKANVVSTQNLLALCLHGNRKDFHYISTVSVGSGLIPDSQGVFFAEDSLDLGQELENPYVKSKFEAEKLVRNARTQGIVTTIFRAGNITFDSETGSFQQNVEENAFFQQIRAYVNLGLIPDQHDQRNLSYVNETSRFLVTLFDKKILDDTVFQTIHLVNPHIVHFSEIFQDQRSNLKIRVLPFPEFISMITRLYTAPGFSEYIDRLLLHLGWRDLLDGNNSTPFFVHSERSLALLSQYSCSWSIPDPLMMNQFIDRALTGRIQFLSSVSSFESLKTPQIIQLARIIVPQYVKDGEMLLRENNQPECVSIISQGFAEVFKHSVDGWEGTIKLLGPGEMCGLESIISADSPFSVEAFEDLFIYTVEQQDLKRYLEENPDISTAFMRTLFETIRQLGNLLIEMG